MVIQINTKVSVGESYGDKAPNITLEDARFFGRPNFSGEEDRFKDARRKFTVLIPNEVADELRALGYNVKTDIPNDEEKAQGRETISHLKVMVDPPTEGGGSSVFVKMGDNKPEKLTVQTLGVMDRARLETMDMEIRAWMYNEEEVRKGLESPQYSARLVALVASIRMNLLDQKYGMLG